MGDIKLFDLSGGTVRELAGRSMAIEKSLQTLIEQHLEAFLGIRFLATEHVTGKTHGGRIDTLGLDENGFPVIIEYKRSMNENVINQGLYYMDWLLDHRAEFELLVMKQYGKPESDRIDWRYPRLLCIAGDFTRYDEHAVLQIDRNVELIRYQYFDDKLLLLELVNSVVVQPVKEKSAPAVKADTPAASKPTATAYKTVSDYLNQAPQSLKDLYGLVEAFAVSLGDGVQKKEMKQYHAFTRLKNFLCIIVHPREHRLVLRVKIDPDTVTLEPGFTADGRRFRDGIGDLEIRIYDADGFERAKPYIVTSYEKS